MNKTNVIIGSSFLGVQIILSMIIGFFIFISGLPSVSESTANMILILTFNICWTLIGIGFVITGAIQKE